MRSSKPIDVLLVHLHPPVGQKFDQVLRKRAGLGVHDPCRLEPRRIKHLLRNGALIVPNFAQGGLAEGAQVFVSLAARARPTENAELCAPATFYPMPSIAYRLARVAVGDGIAAVSLYAVSPHDVVAGHALLRAGSGGLWNERGQALGNATPVTFNQPVGYCFGGGEIACQELMRRPWQIVLADRA
ncbi:hypothetical protein SA496_14985 [Pseudomonas sp. JS3066]|uniref:hypothetical protein n=1 Tax=Pseudomonas sp. JS3066 TaxID=3090665 RepID=UPI002E7B8C72|nr:hypothetical protein [Pseudomonas sp. JS3066]WVK91047.1 hypothetical protein SA496_14985 [Pseudomonas sp. JS3066]